MMKTNPAIEKPVPLDGDHPDRSPYTAAASHRSEGDSSRPDRVIPFTEMRREPRFRRPGSGHCHLD